MTTVEERLTANRVGTLKPMASLTGGWEGVVEVSARPGTDEHAPEGAAIACERCGDPVGAERLAARPATRPRIARAG
ncbi:hypothetical protein ACQEU6_20290 [Spirillospora sp. CA-108201]